MKDQLINVIQQSNGKVAVNARGLHHYLNIKTPFRTWISRTIKYCNLSNDIDYREFFKHSHSEYGGHPRKCVYLSLNAVKIICLFQRRDYRDFALHFLGVKS